MRNKSKNHQRYRLISRRKKATADIIFTLWTENNAYSFFYFTKLCTEIYQAKPFNLGNTSDDTLSHSEQQQFSSGGLPTWLRANQWAQLSSLFHVSGKRNKRSGDHFSRRQLYNQTLPSMAGHSLRGLYILRGVGNSSKVRTEKRRKQESFFNRSMRDTIRNEAAHLVWKCVI